MPTIKDWLSDSSHQLINASIPSARLDAELILANSLGQNRTYLHAHSDQLIDDKQLKKANDDMSSRLNRVPIAYIVGYKEFYGRDFIVNKSTLIPRPESEEIINILKKILPHATYQMPPIKLVDVGTGSGCLGITAKLEFPSIGVTLLDISSDALEVAKLNANKLAADATIKPSDLLQNYTEKPNIIIANLPYVNPEWERSPETDFEPSVALFAENNGLSIINKLIDQASDSLTTDGYLILESDPTQHKSIIEYAKKHSFDLIYQIEYITVFKKSK